MTTTADVVKYQELVKLIGSETRRVKECVISLSMEALERPSPCELWSVRDVVGHLVWFAETYGGMMERGLRGDMSPTPGFPAVPGTLTGPQVDQLYGEGAIDRRRALGKNLLPAFQQTYDWLNEVLQGIGSEGWDKLCYHTHRFRPVNSFLSVIIQELAVHEWDIRSSIESSPSLSVDSIPVLMERIPNSRRPWTLHFPSSTIPAPGSVRYRFHLNGPEGGERDIVAENGRASMEATGDSPADLHLTGATESLILLLFGRIKLDSAIASGRFTAEGDLGLVPDFDRWLAAH